MAVETVEVSRGTGTRKRTQGALMCNTSGTLLPLTFSSEEDPRRLDPQELDEQYQAFKDGR